MKNMTKKALRENYLRMKLMESQLSSEAEKKSAIEQSLEEMDRTLDSLSELRDSGATDSFFTLGSGFYLEASIKDSNRIFINMGSGVLSARNLEDAISILNDRIGNANESLKAIEHSILYISEEIRRTEERMNLLSTHEGA